MLRKALDRQTESNRGWGLDLGEEVGPGMFYTGAFLPFFDHFTYLPQL